MPVDAAMPRYKCHKEVSALKIGSLRRGPGGDVIMTPADEGFGEVVLTGNYVNKHRPAEGGYYVVYADGYKSYSPAKAFEEGYTRIDA